MIVAMQHFWFGLLKKPAQQPSDRSVTFFLPD